MKELSIEEKAKRYDEALEKAKKYHEECKMRGNDWFVEDIEEIFPALKESDDERIRMELIQYLMESTKLPNGEYSRADFFTWLEKQGENKSKKVSIWKHWKDGIAGNGEGELIYLTKVGNTYSLTSCLAFECDYIELSELDNLMLEKQGELSIYNTPAREVILAIWSLGNEWKELTHGSISTEYGTQLEYIQKHWQESDYYPEKQGEKKVRDNLS